MNTSRLLLAILVPSLGFGPVSRHFPTAPARPPAALGADAAGVLRCPSGTARAISIHFVDRNQVQLAGYVLGTGQYGVVLANQTDTHPCDWLPFARTLRGKGYRVLLFEYHDYPHGGDEVTAASGELRRRGVTQVAFVGASVGGAASLVAAGSTVPPPAAVVSISAPADFLELDAASAVTKLTLPLLFIDSKDDTPYSDDARSMFKAAASKDKHLKIVPGDAHGIDILSEPVGPAIRTMILRFIRHHWSKMVPPFGSTSQFSSAWYSRDTGAFPGTRIMR
jgi:esterase/lipase